MPSLRFTAAAHVLIASTLLLACGDTTTTPQGTNDPPPEVNSAPIVEVVSSPDSLVEGEEGEWTVRATDANTTSDKQLRFIIAEYVGMGADTAEVSGPQAQASFSRSYPESGPKDVRFRAVDRGGRVSSVVTSSVTVVVPTFVYTFRFTDMTNHHVGLSGGELRIGETTYPVVGDSVTIELPAGNVDVRYFAPNYENPRQVVRERDGTPYGDRLGHAWSREAGAMTTLPARDATLELFAQPDDWESTQAGQSGELLSGAELYARARWGGFFESFGHNFICTDADLSGNRLEDGVLEFGYLLSKDPTDPAFRAPFIDGVEQQAREFFEDVLPNQASQNIRVVVQAREVQDEPPHAYFLVVQDTAISQAGAHSEQWDGDTGCIQRMAWFAPRWPPSILPGAAVDEGMQALLFHFGMAGSGYWVESPGSTTLTDYSKESMAVWITYQAIGRDEMNW